MMSRMLGAPAGGTTRGCHQGFESLALSLITPPNLGGGGGSCAPSIVVVALGEPGTPMIRDPPGVGLSGNCAFAGMEARPPKLTVRTSKARNVVCAFIGSSPRSGRLLVSD